VIDATKFARVVTNVVVRRPVLWALFRRPLARMFDGLAGEWEEKRIRPTHVQALEAALDGVISPPARVLDVGTGTGVAARAIARRWESAQVTGVDVAEGMVREAQARASSDRERYLVSDASALPFPDGAFDLVVQLNMIPFFDELARVTAPGGAVVLAFSRGEGTPIWVPFDRVRAELEKRGFQGFREARAGEGRSLLATRSEVS
jgi:SAM-dependent methyltransferase